MPVPRFGILSDRPLRDASVSAFTRARPGVGRVQVLCHPKMAEHTVPEFTCHPPTHLPALSVPVGQHSSGGSAMRTITIILAATGLVLTAAGPALAGCSSTELVQVGALSGHPEKDTFGFLCGRADVERTSSIVSPPPRTILQVGASTGEVEKDTLGYLQTAAAQ